MCRPIVMAGIVSGIFATAAFADCPASPEVKPLPRSGTLVVISVDYCPPAVAGPAAAPGGDPAAARRAQPPSAAPATPPAAGQPVKDLYKQWTELTKTAKPTDSSPSAAPSPPAAPRAAPAPQAGPRADAAAIGSAFSIARNFLEGPVTQELKGIRIDERDRVAVKLTHFNFINFAAEYTIEKTVIEAYVTLNKLWSQALGLGLPFAAASVRDTGPCPEDATFEQCVVDWMWAQILTSRQLNVVTGSFKNRVALDQSIIDGNIKPDSMTMETLRAQLVQIQSDTLTRKPTSLQEIEWYTQVQTAHDRLVGQLDAYLRLAELTVSGQTKNIDKQAAGTLVTVKIVAMNALGNPAGKPVEIQYFVHSKYPVTFHAGYLYSSLKEVKFEQVRTTAGADLFQQVHKPENVNTYAAFLSYQLFSGNTGRYGTGVLATLGTDFKDPAKRLYIGGSVKFLSRVFAGVGVVSSDVSEGVNPVVEQIGSALGARDLFTAVTTRRDWKPYFHISFGVFQ
jgi:hypothetical protein